MTRHDFVTLPDASTYMLGNARVPACCIERPRVVENATDHSNGLSAKEWQTCIDGVVTVDIEVSGARITDIRPAAAAAKGGAAYLDVRESMVLPAFVDLHTHIGGRERFDPSAMRTSSLALSFVSGRAFCISSSASTARSLIWGLRAIDELSHH